MSVPNHDFERLQAQLIMKYSLILLVVLAILIVDTDAYKKKCLRRRKKALKKGKWAPECTADGKFQMKQCNDELGKCWCVSMKKGKPRFGNFAFPKDEGYDCASK